MTFVFGVVTFLICALLLGIGLLLKSKNPLGCKRCGNPEKKECLLCKRDQPDSEDGSIDETDLK